MYLAIMIYCSEGILKFLIDVSTSFKGINCVRSDLKNIYVKKLFDTLFLKGCTEKEETFFGRKTFKKSHNASVTAKSFPIDCC